MLLLTFLPYKGRFQNMLALFSTSWQLFVIAVAVRMSYGGDHWTDDSMVVGMVVGVVTQVAAQILGVLGPVYSFLQYLMAACAICSDSAVSRMDEDME